MYLNREVLEWDAMLLIGKKKKGLEVPSIISCYAFNFTFM